MVEGLGKDYHRSDQIFIEKNGREAPDAVSDSKIIIIN